MNFLTHALAPSQIVGYVALVLGITAFLQKRDQRLRLMVSIQSIAYAAHFWLLGNVPASTAAIV